MSNLLPKERLDVVWEGYRSRVVLVGAIVLSVSAALSGAAFLPAFVALKVESNAQEKQSASLAAQTDPNPQSRAERADISRSQTLLARIAPIVSATSSPTEIINSALSLRPPGISVKRISFVSGKGGSITINGEANGRESINQYRDALSEDARFEGVSIPVGALVGSEGGAFTVTLTGNF